MIDTSNILAPNQREVYRVRPGWQIFGLVFALIACLGWPLLTLYFALSQPDLFAGAWILPVFLGGAVLMAGVGLFIFLAITLPRLVISPAGVEYYDFGFYVRTGWDNIAGQGQVQAGNTIVKGLLLREPVAQMSGWLKATLVLQPILFIIALLSGRYAGGIMTSGFTRVIPVSKFVPQWESSHLADQLRLYAPQVFSDTAAPILNNNAASSDAAKLGPFTEPKLFAKENKDTLIKCAGLIGATVVFTAINLLVIGAQVGGAKATWKGHSGEVNSVAYSPDGKIIASGSADKTVKLWDAATDHELFTLKGHQENVNSIAFSPDGKTLASASGGGYAGTTLTDYSIKLWDVGTGRELATLKSQEDKVNAVAFSPDGKTLASGTGAGYHTTSSQGFIARIWNVATGQEIASFPNQPSPVQAVAFSPDGKQLAIGLANGVIKLVEISTGRVTTTLSTGDYYESLNTIAFNPTGTIIGYGGDGGQIVLWDIAKHTQLFKLSVYKGTANPVEALAFSPDGKYFATGCEDHTIKLWNTASGKQVHTFAGHSGPVKSLAFSPDGKTLVSGSGDPYNGEDHTIRLWEVKSSY